MRAEMNNLSNSSWSPPRESLRHLVSDGFWVIMESIGSRGLTMLSMMVAARTLGSSAFGQLGAIQATLFMLSGLIADALRLTATRQIAAADNRNPTELGRLVGTVFFISSTCATLVTLIMYFLTPLIAKHALNNPSLTPHLRIGLIWLVSEAINGLCIGVLTGLRKFQTMAYVGIISGSLLFGSIYIFASSGLSAVLWCLATSSAVSLLLRGTIILVELKKHNTKPYVSILHSDIITLKRVSLPALLSSIIFTPANWLVTVMLVNKTNGYHELGLFGIASQWFSLLIFFPNVVGIVLLPYFSKAFGSSDFQSVRAGLKAGTITCLIVSIPTSCIVAIFSETIVGHYGSDYQNGGVALSFTAIAATAGALQNLLGNLLVSIDRMWRALIIQITWAVVYVVSAYAFLTLIGGASALAAAMLMAYIAKLIHAYWFLSSNSIESSAGDLPERSQP